MFTIFFTLNYVENWFSLSYGAIAIPMCLSWVASFFSRSFQFHNLQWNVSKLSLLKGGKLLVVERSSLDGR